ncbi:MAG: helix-turn-helix domain-containing protein [Bacteroidales bacterium]|nr:helix-turn-helix domain-containing protein [Bacteroidales bacterium]
METNSLIELAASYVSQTDVHVFLTGKAGTGKTTFLHNLHRFTSKRYVVVAPTGVAALNAGGVTIHSFFQLPFGPQLPDAYQNSMTFKADPKSTAARFQQLTREKRQIIRSLDLLVIDEISMVRADLLDAIDAVLRRYRNSNIAFGGVQLLMIGDLWQLPPIAREEEWRLLSPFYDTVYFFDSYALRNTDYVCIQLEKVYRQQDQYFINLLNAIRNGYAKQNTISELNKRYLPEFVASDPKGYITLTTHNYQADTINQNKLDALNTDLYHFEASIEGDFPEYLFPTSEELSLKIGAQVMFVKNDPSPAKVFYNGKIGILVDIDQEEERLIIHCQDENETIETGRLDWQYATYSINEETKEIEEKVLGTFTQYPLKLAWAITIHKSQGLSFDKAMIDAQAAFTHGQVYVALSRCRTLEGMILRSPIPVTAIKENSSVQHYMNKMEAGRPDEKSLAVARKNFQIKLLKSVFDFGQWSKLWAIFNRQLHQNANQFETGLLENLNKQLGIFSEKLADVAEKFVLQIERLAQDNTDLEANPILQERLNRAAVYMLPLIENAYRVLRIKIETDNKALKKRLLALQSDIFTEIAIKQATIEVLKEQFSMVALLEARAKAAIDPALKKSKRPERSVKDDTLYPILKKWRDNLAAKKGVDQYQILPRKSLQGISKNLPLTKSDLSMISGIGKIRLQIYGNDILKMVQEFVNEKKKSERQTDSSKKAVMTSSTQQTYEMFCQGMSCEEIAAERRLALSTVENHIAELVQKGNIHPKDLMEQEKIELITEYFTEVDDLRLGPAKEVLGDEISYSELRWMRSWMLGQQIIEDTDNIL